MRTRHKKRLPTTPFAIKLQQSRPDEIVQALEVKPVIPNVYCDFRRSGRTNIRLLVLLANGSEGKNLKKRADAGINKQTKYRGEQPLFEAFKMLRLNLTIMECQNQKGSTTPKDLLYCSCGRDGFEHVDFYAGSPAADSAVAEACRAA